MCVTLKSQIPELIYKATLTHFDNNMQNPSILDLGCGTGICGALFSTHTHKLIGVDLSEKMLMEAEKKKIYASLFASDINEYLENNSENYDVVISSDVLIYTGKLNNIFKEISKTLRWGGLFSFSIESLTDSHNDYSLDDTGRYKHNHHYISQLATENNFSILSSNETVLREQSKENVIGRIYVLKK